ncbi:cation transporter [Sphingobium boeckii]|uniref:Divalent metal cation (Fe/Co/Zn/Cd) transporter n=1 Tax=Sphingobium boeckii TaxID=1082345 RepID=A0A7W9AKW3_9SPHN|nr:cation transporter [Sphingobium boeckii]MBB5687548.1 divalent metal cation (Fe/Co/Zn/Cd) transporter [Sphingobium boeckii]
MRHRGHPAAIRQDMARAVRLEWWNVGWTISIIIVMGITMGGSQAMKTAWVEDTLGLIPPLVFLIASHFEARPSTKRFHFGFHRVNSLGFLVAAVALATVGLLLLWDSAMTLIAGENVTVSSVRFLGHDIWLGWFMLAAQAYSIIPPLIIGRKELPIAERLRDKLLHTDALMNRANWLTGAAGIAGIAGLGMGWWWADSAAAAFISLGIISDGVKSLRVATAELVDGVPRALDSDDLSDEAALIAKALRAHFPKTRILLRETGRYIRAEVIGAHAPKNFDADSFDIPGLECRWRLESIAFHPPGKP